MIISLMRCLSQTLDRLDSGIFPLRTFNQEEAEAQHAHVLNMHRNYQLKTSGIV